MDGQVVPLGARAYDVLLALVERRERVVSKSELLELVWPGLVVEEGNLPVQISTLRKILGHSAIATIPTFGYRFVLDVADSTTIPSARQAARVESPTNLPCESTTLFGRESDLAELHDLLSRYRLVTLTGVAGIGKSRLALRAATEGRNVFADGVWWVACDSIDAPEALPSAIASALGVKDSPDEHFVDLLVQHLKTRQLLLVLDSCERHAEACAQIAHGTLRAGGKLKILATSSVPLRVEGERVFVTPALRFAGKEDAGAQPAPLPAVQLFFDRARSVRAGLQFGPDEAEKAADICARLDGIPLAIELAAARLETLTIDELAARLSERFTLLRGVDRGALPRHQTLRAAFDWSYEMLTSVERTVLQRLTVFTGTFTLDAATQVASDDALDPNAVTDVLFRLTARSMVASDVSGSKTRFRLLQGVRDYAFEKLGESGDRPSRLELRRAEHFMRLYENALQDWFAMSDLQWRRTYLEDIVNVRASLSWSLSDPEGLKIGASLAARSGAVWPELTLIGEGRRYLERAVASADHAAAYDRACLHLWRGVLMRDPDAAGAAAAFESAISAFEAAGNKIAQGYSLARLAGALSRAGRLTDAQGALERARPLLEGAPPKAMARYYDESGDLKVDLGDLSGARICFERALALHEYAGADRYALIALGGLGDVALALGDRPVARARYEEAVAKMRAAPVRNMYSMGNFLAGLADIYTESGEADKAMSAIRESRLLLEATGLEWAPDDYDAMRIALRGQVRNAARVAGYVDAQVTAGRLLRKAGQRRVREQLRQILAEGLGGSEAELLLADGQTLTAEEAKRLVV